MMAMPLLTLFALCLIFGWILDVGKPAIQAGGCVSTVAMLLSLAVGILVAILAILVISAFLL